MNHPYALLPICILSLLIYLLSYSLTRLKVIPYKSHRQFWNILLLITFLVTAIFGLILATQVIYKLNIPGIKQLLTWHVNFGIGMAMIAIFHFLWHLSYYTKMLRFKTESEGFGDSEAGVVEHKEITAPVRTRFMPVFCLGFTTIVVQIVLLREFLSVFYGNELVIGIVLTNWLLLTALGARIARITNRINKHDAFQGTMLIVLSLFAIVIVAALNIFRNVIFQPGVLVNIFEILGVSFLMLLPFCILSGFMFTWFASYLSDHAGKNMIHTAYAVEATGSLLGGLLFSFVMVYFMRSLHVLSLILIFNLCIRYIRKDFRKELKKHWIIPLISLILIACLYIFNVDQYIRKFVYPNQELIYLKDTPYGSLAVSKTDGQLNFYENTSLLYSTNDPISNEEDVHYAMVQFNDPQKILLISGGISGTISEILKYNIEKLDYVEINPWIVRLGKKYSDELDNPKVEVHVKDPRIFLNSANEKYDVVLIQVPEPTTALINRYYTAEFYSLLKQKLQVDGIVSIGLPSTINYVSAEANELNSVIIQTLSSLFDSILVIPGNKNYILASDGHLDIRIPELIEQKGIENVYVNQYYLDTFSLQERSLIIMDQLIPDAPVNKDFRPVSYLMHLKYWMSQFNINYWIPFGLIIIFFIFLMLRIRPLTFGIFAGGFAGSSMELLIIILFQIVYGYVYQYVGIIIAVFMTGLALGTLYREKLLKTGIGSFILVQFLISGVVILIPILVMLFNKTELPDLLIHTIIVFVTILISVIVGMQFSLGSGILRNNFTSRAADLYSFDLIGAAFGALIISVFCIPILGIVTTAYLVAGINLLSALVTIGYRRAYMY